MTSHAAIVYKKLGNVNAITSVQVIFIVVSYHCIYYKYYLNRRYNKLHLHSSIAQICLSTSKSWLKYSKIRTGKSARGDETARHIDRAPFPTKPSSFWRTKIDLESNFSSVFSLVGPRFFTEWYTKHSSVLPLRLVYFSVEQTLVRGFSI